MEENRFEGRGSRTRKNQQVGAKDESARKKTGVMGALLWGTGAHPSENGPLLGD
jgi:hypothetical protein